MTVATPQVTVNGLSLNGIEPTTGVKWTLEKFSWWGSPGSTVDVVQKTRGHGGWAGDAFLQSRRIVASGLVRAPSEAALEDALDRLSAAVPTNDVMVVVTEPARTRFAMAQREDDILVELVVPTIARWSIQMVATDARKFAEALVGSTALPSSSGGMSFPMSFPMSFDSVVVPGQVNLFNPGNILGPVQLRITGPVTGPIVTHIGSGQSLMFASSLVLGAGEWIDVDMENHSVLAQGQASRATWVTSRGWSGFEPGANTWAFTAAVFNPASLLTVMATPAWE